MVVCFAFKLVAYRIPLRRITLAPTLERDSGRDERLRRVRRVRRSIEESKEGEKEGKRIRQTWKWGRERQSLIREEKVRLMRGWEQ